MNNIRPMARYKKARPGNILFIASCVAMWAYCMYLISQLPLPL